MMTVIHDAHYRDETLDEFRFNPLIEAMPAPLEPGHLDLPVHERAGSFYIRDEKCPL